VRCNALVTRRLLAVDEAGLGLVGARCGFGRAASEKLGKLVFRIQWRTPSHYFANRDADADSPLTQTMLVWSVR
jgi:hypothetical protein